MQREGRTLRVQVNGTPAPRTHERRPLALWPLLALMGFLAIGGFVGGISFVVDPTGAGLGVKQSWLEQTPVSDYLLPGVFLLVVYAIGSAIMMAGLAWRFSPGPLQRIDRRMGVHWSWTGTILVGAVLVGWILYQFVIIPETILLQPILIAVGILMIAIPVLPSMRGYYATRRA